MSSLRLAFGCLLTASRRAPRFCVGAAAGLLVASSLTAQVRVVTVGDSITVGVGSSESSRAYPAVLGGLLGPGYTVSTEATSGATALREGRPSYWLTSGVENTVAKNPDIVTILLGTNDSKATNWGAGDQFVDDYVGLIEALGAGSADPDIYPVLPPPATDVQVRGSVIANEIIPGILRAARQRNLPVIDLHTPFLDSVPTLLPDGVHPNDTGYQIAAQRIRDGLVNNQVLRPVPAPYQALDVGATGLAGAEALDASGTTSVMGAGVTIGGRADAFRYVYVTTSGDADIVTRVAGLRGLDPLFPTRPEASAGVMIRETLGRDARHASVVVTAGQGVSFRWRDAKGGAGGAVTVSGVTPPVYVRVQRSGGEFTGSYSADGVNWTTIGAPRRITMAGAAHAGLATSSGSAEQIAHARFNQLGVTRQGAGAPVAPGGLAATASSGSVTLNWAPVPGADSYRILRATTPDGAFAERGTATAATFSDGGASSGATYYYAVVARDGTLESPASMAVKVGPPAAPTGVNAEMLSFAQARVEWNPRDDATGFRVKRSAGGGAFATVATVSDGSTSFVDTGLTAGTGYRYVVTAFNGSGESANSAIISPALDNLYPRPTAPRAQSGGRSWLSSSSDEPFMRRDRPENAEVIDAPTQR